MSQETPGTQSDLPEGVVDALPAAGWESADAADAETRERSDADAAAAGQPSDAPSDAATGYDADAVDDVETAEVTQGIDPDLATDDDEGAAGDD
ncbi:hypothetical protein [Microbacterium flavum]|uniref:hypothetical protein n=1 Tax=Microbacterium flavum TaxID=415216 RepID=UPI0024AD799F|nr:hypothetical protein [Microbacterium flavum]